MRYPRSPNGLALQTTRRRFLQRAVAAGAGVAAAPLWTRSDEPPSSRGFSLRLGYAAITWDGKDEQAIDDIAAAGYHGIQLRTSVLSAWRERPAELRARLKDKGLELLCFSSGNVDATPEKEREYLETHVENARFVKALGGELLQVVSRRPKKRAPTPAEFEALGRVLTAIGRQTLDLGVRLVYHNHMNAFGEAPDEVARVLEVSDPRFVSLLLDVAHYLQGGGDPVAAVSKHRDRLAILHLKDVIGPLPADNRPPRLSYLFVELGRGRVDLPGVIAALRTIQFRGPAVIELDAVPDAERTAADCAAVNKRYAVEKLGLTL